MTCIRSGVKPRKIEPIAPPAVLTSAKQATVTFDDDDDNIFADAGDYVCEPRHPNAARLAADRIVFSPDAEASETVQEPVVSMRDAIMQAKSTAGQLGVFEKSIQPEDLTTDDNDQHGGRSPSETGTQQRARMLSAMDEYDEYTSGAQIGYDSDEDVTTAAGKNPGPAPSATKISRARAREKQKLNTQWQQINSIIERNKDKGGYRRPGTVTDETGPQKKPRPARN